MLEVSRQPNVKGGDTCPAERYSSRMLGR